MKYLKQIQKNKLKELRLSRNLKQQDVAKLIGLTSQDRISHWEKGSSIPSLINLFRLSKLFAVSVEEMYPSVYSFIQEGSQE